MSLDVYLSAPTKCPHCGGELSGPTERYERNITHNLTVMAGKAGIYQHLWCPDEISITRASQLIEPLRAGLEKLKAEPDFFRQFNPSNGWGSYEGLVNFVADYLAACEANPHAEVSVSR